MVHPAARTHGATAMSSISQPQRSVSKCRPARRAIALALMLLAPFSACSAATGEMALSSQLVDRGVAITRPGAALQGAVSWNWPSGWSLGVSGGFELRDPDHLADAVVQVSRYRNVSGDWRMQTRLLYYHYSSIVHAGFYEAGMDWVYREVLTFGLSAVYSAQRSHRLRPAADLDLNWPLQRNLSLTAGLGVAGYSVPVNEYYRNYEQESASYYRYGHLGLLWTRGRWQFKTERMLIGAEDRERMHRLAPSKWLATLSVSF